MLFSIIKKNIIQQYQKKVFIAMSLEGQNRKMILESQQFQLSVYLEKLCKKQHLYGDQEGNDRFQIDFIELEKDLKRMQGIQERTCQQVVEFVDQHRERFIEINNQLSVIQDKVKGSQSLLNLLGSSIEQYKTECYLNESKIQNHINAYELKLLQEQMLSIAKSEAMFMMKFNNHFQDITNKQIGKLNLTQKYIISRFTYKLQYLKVLFSHQIIQDFIPENLQIKEIVISLSEEFQFYLGEQLSKYQSLIFLTRDDKEKKKISEALGLIKGWFINLGKKEEYFRVLEKNTIEKEMNVGEKVLVSNKTNLLSGKDANIMESVFTKILESVCQFPENYPQDRLKNILFSFFKKEQLKFLYTYAMPIFPLAFSGYLSAINNSKIQQWLKIMLKDYHGWNLKMWVIVRQKNILDRSNNDNDMFKWVDIIFRSNCMLPGTLTDFLKLTFKLINRYLSRISKSDFLASNLNRLVEQQQKLGQLVATKIRQNLGNEDFQNIASKVKTNIDSQLSKIIKDLLHKNINNVAISCQNSLETVKSFVSKIIKKDKEFTQNNTINKHENLFRPLNSFLKNNQELSAETVDLMVLFVEGIVVKYYDKHYAVQIYSYCKDQLISEQVSLVMQVVGRQRTTLFKKEEEE